MGNTDIAFMRIEKGIYQRGELSFQVKLKLGGDTISATFDSLHEARAFRDLKRAGYTLDPEANKIALAKVKKAKSVALTVGAALDRYVAEVTPTKKSAATESLRIAKIKRYPIARLSLYRCGPEDVLRFLDALRKDEAPDSPRRGLNRRGVSDATARQYAALISSLFRVAIKRWREDVDNPIQRIELPKAGKPRKRRLEGEEEQYLLAALDQARNPLAGPLTRLAIESAMRQGELLKLKWKDVKLAEMTGSALLRGTKNGEDRVVPLSAEAVQILRGIPRKSHEPRVFPVPKTALRTIWETAKTRAHRTYLADCTAQGRVPEKGFLENLRFHDLRHEATSRLFELGLDRVEAASVTGHKTLQMLKDYTHLRAERLAQRINKAKAG